MPLIFRHFFSKILFGLTSQLQKAATKVSNAVWLMFADGDGLLDQVIDVFGQVGSQALGLQNTQDLVASDEADLCHAVRVPEDDTDLGRSHALLGQFVDLLLDFIIGQLEPGWH